MGHGGGSPKTYRGYGIEARIFLGIALFFAVVDGIYFFTSKENSGSTMLVMTVFLGFLPGAYLWWWGRHMKPRPEDSDSATFEESAGSVGAFPSSSIWPFVFGMGMAGVALAFVFGAWLAIFGGALGLGALIGYTVESRRGGYI
jgi:hypothetical protein